MSGFKWDRPKPIRLLISGEIRQTPWWNFLKQFKRLWSGFCLILPIIEKPTWFGFSLIWNRTSKEPFWVLKHFWGIFVGWDTWKIILNFWIINFQFIFTYCHTRLHPLDLTPFLSNYEISFLLKSYCHTRLHLGFSAKLGIWQVSAYKMEPRSGIVIWQKFLLPAPDPAQTDPPTAKLFLSMLCGVPTSILNPINKVCAPIFS